MSVRGLEDKDKSESLLLFVSVKINGTGNILQQSKFYTLTGLDILNLGGAHTMLVTRAH